MSIDAIELNDILKEEKELRNKQEILKINKTIDNLKYQQVKKNPSNKSLLLGLFISNYIYD